MSSDKSTLRNSKAVQILTDTRTLHAILGVIVAASVVQVLRADVDTAIQFLSFLGLFALVAIIFFPYTEPIRK